MARKLYIAGNWKLNYTAAQAAEIITELKAAVEGVDSIDIGIAPVFTALTAAVDAAAGSNIKIGAQNVHWAESGAFTGEISVEMLKTD